MPDVMNSRNMKNGAFDMELRLILQKIEKDTTSDRKSIHGDGHWERVAGFGRLLAEKERLNERVLVLFGYFHDCQRLNDGHDPDHGPRAAQYVAGFPQKLLGLTPPRNRSADDGLSLPHP